MYFLLFFLVLFAINIRQQVTRNMLLALLECLIQITSLGSSGSTAFTVKLCNKHFFFLPAAEEQKETKREPEPRMTYM